MTAGRRHRRILIYSHDSFGLGHLRRCREIAHTLVAAERRLSVLILSGSPIIGSFDFRARVDFVRIPGVIKLRNGEYTSLALHIDIEQTLAMRASIIEHTAKIYDPDLFIVDKEPLGLRGEVEATLGILRSRGTPCVLGLRDVLDEPAALAAEWQRKHALPAVNSLYDAIWIYGLPKICDPLAGLDLPAVTRNKIAYTGYLKRNLPKAGSPLVLDKFAPPFIVVTVGGGGDGDVIVDWVLRAYESERDLPYPAVIVLGPFMRGKLQAEFQRRAAKLPNVETITFDAHLESLMDRAAGIVCMGGYNTFCEILTFDKRALVVPRVAPRREQFIRASKAQELGLLRMLEPSGERRASTMAEALRALPQQPRPSEAVAPGLLGGRSNVLRLTRQWLRVREERLAVTPMMRAAAGQ